MTSASDSVPVEATYSGAESTEGVPPPPIQIVLPPGASCFTLSDAGPIAPVKFIVTSSDAQEIDFSQLITRTVVRTAANTAQVYPVDLELEHLKQQLMKIAPISTRALKLPDAGPVESEIVPEAAGAHPVDNPVVTHDEDPAMADVDEGRLV